MNGLYCCRCGKVVSDAATLDGVHDPARGGCGGPIVGKEDVRLRVADPLKECICPTGSLLVREALVKVWAQVKKGYLLGLCPVCDKLWSVDMETQEKRRVTVH
jgi:hypothetical protein